MNGFDCSECSLARAYMAGPQRSGGGSVQPHSECLPSSRDDFSGVRAMTRPQRASAGLRHRVTPNHSFTIFTHHEAALERRHHPPAE